SDARRAHAEPERVGSRRHALHVLRAEKCRQLGLECAKLLAAEKLHAIEDTCARGQQLLAYAAVLAPQIDHSHPRPRSRPRYRARCQPHHSLHGALLDSRNISARHEDAQERSLTFGASSPKDPSVLEVGQGRGHAMARWGPALLLALAFGVLASIRLDDP